MFDIIKRILVTLTSGAVIFYTGSLLASQSIVVQPEYIWMNLLSLLGIIAIAIYMLIVYGAYPLYHPMQKRILTVLGIGLIVFWQTVLLNDYNTWIYVWDIMKVFGVLIIRFGSTWLLTSKKISQQKKEKSIEIIEA